ncbi:MAG: GFA family protein [Alphaproteobacteria bacterium]|nr:GFA family protein [Alphaproteobacteria bacterium]MBU0792612.1 GFA family protein [Alphaproteobacteria bacterium]MBU0876756.1 GFA family protein [Alphaproteobacteria bacterium]MBU1769002.1 GFA family protein [Alphaproteobacteria bacterium]
MAIPVLPWKGGCRCGKIRFRVDQAPLFTSVCHCRGCQLMTASAFATTLTVPADALTVTEGEPVLGGLHGDIARHFHCDWCKSWVFTRLPAEFGAVNVRATMLDDPSWFVPFAEMQTAEKLPWVATSARRSFERFPEPTDYPVLIEEYRTQ